MKWTTAAIILLSLLSICFLFTACKKAATLPKSKEVLVPGKWSINRIQLRLYYGGVFTKDTIIKRDPKPENFITFGTDGSFEYRFNSTVSDIGTFQFVGADSIIATATPTAHQWKMLTLTDELFTMVSTSNADVNFPGATVETYHTLVR